MKKSIWTGVCTAIVGFAAAAMAAQTGSTPQSTNQPSSDHRVTVTGCLAAAPSAPSDTATGTTGAGSTATAGTTGTAGSTAGGSTAADTQRFMLTNATTAPAGATGTTAGATTSGSATAGTTAAEPSSAAGAASTYRLLANPAALSAHVGKKLELTGTIENGSASSSSAATTAESNAPLLRVESGKIIAASCQE